jgi:excinuclease ABC subunit C
VGKAKNLKNRVRSYFHQSRSFNPKLEVLVSKIDDIEVIVTNSEVEALILEANLIKKFKPRYNVSLKDDKGYPYIVITNEPFPRIFTTRKIKSDGSRYFGPYTDVKALKQTLKLIRDIFMVRSCKYRIDDEVIRRKKIRLCLDYYIKKCGGPCEGLISSEEYNRMIEQVAQLLNGKTDELVRSLQAEMERLAGELKFEEAALIRDKIKALQIYTSKQSIVTAEPVDRDIFAVVSDENDACGVIFRVRDGKLIGSQRFLLAGVKYKSEAEVIESFISQYYLSADYIPEEIFIPVKIDEINSIAKWLSGLRGGDVKVIVPEDEDGIKLISMCRLNARYQLDEYKLQKMKLKEENISSPVIALQKELNLPRPPRKIECFDISNIQGSDIVASLVVFENGKPRRSEYRRFKIRTVSGEPNDFASMEEVVERRYSRLLNEGGRLPDLIVVDGGKGQLSSAMRALDKLGIKEQPIVALAKRFEELYLPYVDEPRSLPKTSPALYLLQQIRNEAHRVAITFHREVRKRRSITTKLLEIEGIGEKRAKLLLSKFGSVEEIRKTPVEKLSEVIGKKLAWRIKESLDPKE